MRKVVIPIKFLMSMVHLIAVCGDQGLIKIEILPQAQSKPMPKQDYALCYTATRTSADQTATGRSLHRGSSQMRNHKLTVFNYQVQRIDDHHYAG